VETKFKTSAGKTAHRKKFMVRISPRNLPFPAALGQFIRIPILLVLVPVPLFDRPFDYEDENEEDEIKKVIRQ
jgi:hypothetical protein